MEETLNQAELRAECQRLSRRLEALEAELGTRAETGDRPAADAHSRRWLLTAGAGAAVAGAAAILGDASPAAANNGAFFVLGNANNTTNTATATTELAAASGSNAGFYTRNTDGGLGILGRAGASSTNITYNAAGVHGDTQGAANTVGVLGTSTEFFGVLGKSYDGSGVVGQSQWYIDIAAPWGGRIYQLPRPTGTALRSQELDFAKGEQVRTSDGQLWICVAGGNPGTWQKVAAAAPGANGGSLNMLESPFRLFDSRNAGGAIDGDGTKLAAGGTKTLQVTGTAPDGGGVADGVPANAIGVLGTITVTKTELSGYAQVYPGPAVPSTSNVNWSGPGQDVAASFICGLTGTGAMTVKVRNPTHVIIDVAGYVY